MPVALQTTTGSLFVLAAGAAPPFFAEVASLLLASAAMAYLCHRLKVTPIVSFLVTGALIGPHALGLVRDPALIEAAAEVGVVLLLFTIGIELSLEKLAKIQKLIFLGGGLQVGLVVAAVTGLLALWGVDWRSGVFTGCLVALSSTAIVLKLLMSRGESDTPAGRAVLGILIFQDLAVVAMVLLVPMLGKGGGSAGGIGWALAEAGLIVALTLVVARRVMPKVLEAVARTCSQEIFVLTVMAICFGTAWLTSLAGVSLSLGAFLAGLVVSESRFSDMAFGEIQPLQILFSATFFVSVGLLLDLEFMMEHLALVLVLVAGVLLVKLLCAGVAVRSLGFGAGTVAFASLMIAQVGEFSFVLERTGRDGGLFPAGIEAGGPQVFIAATVLLMMATPLLAALGRRAEARSTARARRAAESDATLEPPGGGEEGPAGAVEGDAPVRGPREHDDLHEHVIIAGYGKGGRVLARALDEAGVEHLILTSSPEGARDAEADGLRVIRGNYGRQYELSLAGVSDARLLVVPDDDPETTRRVVRAAKALHPDLPVLASARLDGEIEALRGAGADRVVSHESEGVRRLVEEVLRGGVPEPPAEADRRAVRLSRAQRENPGCSHTPRARPVAPGTGGCEECLALGGNWHHLRLCMTCGHVGCCDESKHKHATAHFHETGHPIIRSHQPGETWAWCYEDEIVL